MLTTRKKHAYVNALTHAKSYTIRIEESELLHEDNDTDVSVEELHKLMWKMTKIQKMLVK